MPITKSRWLPFVLVMLIALIGRVLLLASDSVSFHSDEAIVGLMARHILAGERPTFFYGQAYMGSLDAWLVAMGFRLFGESVTTIRLVQSALYLLVVASAYAAAWALTRSHTATVVTMLTFAIGSPLLTLYTTATLGGYNETLLFGHLLVAIGVDLGEQDNDLSNKHLLWLALGLTAGIGWWTNALIVVYALPVGIWLLLQLRARVLPGALIALVGFVIGSAPWWVYALQNDLAPLRFFLPDVLGGRETVGAVIPSVPFDQRLFGLLLFGLPSVTGLRFPWSGEFFAPVVGLVVAAVFAVALYQLARRGDMAQRVISFGMIAFLCALFLLTRFSSDPSGRYFLPLTLPFGVALGLWVAGIPRPLKSVENRFSVAAALVVLVLGYFAAGQISAARAPLGFTTQFVAQTHLPNTDDAALIAWLNENDIQHGYTTYWISFRLAFLSAERIQLSAALPDKSDLAYTPAFERYALYRTATDAAQNIAYITANIPELEGALEAWFVDSGTRYQVAQVGIYRIYYDFEPTTPRPPLPFIN
ncbi:MAG: glycosyltransferase family 39 protein [Chloroflexota bacterium]|nr:glycosyltransferase family 39 protein [Chloroflexota bacterium]